MSEARSAIDLGPWVFDYEAATLTHRHRGEQRQLERQQRDVLGLLAPRRGRPVSYDTLYEEACGANPAPQDELARARWERRRDEAVQKAVSRVRELFESDPCVSITARRGLYSYVLEANEGSSPGPPPPALQPAASVPFAKQDGPVFAGREEELRTLDTAWNGRRTRIAVVIAAGGAGKSALVARWKSGLLAREDRGGIERYFEWSFYNQGTSGGASAHTFVVAALRFLGAAEVPGASPREQAESLAELVCRERMLLVLDGVEPLQGPPDHEGEASLRDEILQVFLGRLAVENRGLCVITTRAKVRNLLHWPLHVVAQWKLGPLRDEEGACVLRYHGVKGSDDELARASGEVRGHALTLTLIGSYFRVAFADNPNIARRDCFGFKRADEEVHAGHAFRVMRSYEALLEQSGRKVEHAILRLLGLFDRPATPDCLGALKRAAIPGLTDALKDLSTQKWTTAIHYLTQLDLITTAPWQPRAYSGFSEDIGRAALSAGETNQYYPLGDPKQTLDIRGVLASGVSLDAHPLVRDYFAYAIEGSASREAHGRLFEHLCKKVPFWPNDPEGLEVLYEAIAHGCRAGRHEEAYKEVFDNRVQRGTQGPHAYYSRTRSTLDADLTALKHFFVEPWTEEVSTVCADTQSRILVETAFRLRNSNRVRESVGLLKRGMSIAEERQNWSLLARFACTLSEVYLMLGEVRLAVETARFSLACAERSGDTRLRVVRRATLADALHQHGELDESAALFAEAESMLPRAARPARLDGLRSAQYGDLLLREAERLAGQAFARRDDPQPIDSGTRRRLRALLAAVEERALATVEVAVTGRMLLDEALDRLTLGRMHLYRLVLGLEEEGTRAACGRELEGACTKLERASRRDYLPGALVSLAWMHALDGDSAHVTQALDQAWRYAERGELRLHQADVCLHRARLLRDRSALDAARQLIADCDYLRRQPELDDALEAARGW